ncbi:hypothetical protein [Streptacidiphilus cavernicola]|uniref:Uncharacterized protein n=1 Tax=Streptacidiphilus cavernicola TaxID=3342716 RepID=A0ABV6VYL8_9ACTN
MSTIARPAFFAPITVTALAEEITETARWIWPDVEIVVLDRRGEMAAWRTVGVDGEDVRIPVSAAERDHAEQAEALADLRADIRHLVDRMGYDSPLAQAEHPCSCDTPGTCHRLTTAVRIH